MVAFAAKSVVYYLVNMYFEGKCKTVKGLLYEQDTM
jgi:hypothetical protein